MCWVHGPKAFNAVETARRAEGRGVAFAPARNEEQTYVATEPTCRNELT